MLTLPDVITIGPLMIPTAYLLYIAAFPLAWLFMRRKLIQEGAEAALVSQVAEVTTNAAIIWILIWKFGGVIFYPSLIWENPWGVLRFVGTWKETLVATAIAFIYLVVSARKRSISLALLLDLIPYGFAVIILVRYLPLAEYGHITNVWWGIRYEGGDVRYHPVHLYYSALSVATLIVLWNKPLGSWRSVRDFLLMFGNGLFLVSFTHAGAPEFGWIGSLQIVSLCMIAFGLCILKRERR